MPEQPVVEQQRADTQRQTPDKSRKLGTRVQRLLHFLGHRDKTDPDGTLTQIAEADSGTEKPNQTQHRGNWYHRRTERPRERRGARETQDPHLSTFNFEAYLQQNPPIEGIFDPDRAEKNAPEHIRQQEAMATCRTLIETYIEQDTNKDSANSRAKLKALVEKFGANYGFTDPQKSFTKDLIDEFYNHRKNGIDLLTMYTDERGVLQKSKLVEKLTGMKFADNIKFDIVAGPWGLEITTDNESTQRLLYGDKPPRTDFCAGGLAFPGNVPPFIILNRGYSNQETLGHERQHVRYALTGRVFARHSMDRIYYGKYPEVITEQGQIENRLRTERSFALDRAKDEIFAYTFNAEHFPSEFFVAQDGNPYDYLYDAREIYTRIGNPTYRKLAQQILVDEYRSTLVSAAIRLEDLRKAGYSHRESIALLADKPLDAWAETIETLLESKGAGMTSQDKIDEVLSRPVAQPRTTEGLPIIDVVIRPDWQKERAFITAQKKAREIPENKQTPAADQEITNDASLGQLNKSLYDNTREAAGSYLAELGLEQYFTLLDQQTLELSNELQHVPPSEQQIKEAAGRILANLEQSLKQLRSRSN